MKDTVVVELSDVLELYETLLRVCNGVEYNSDIDNFDTADEVYASTFYESGLAMLARDFYRAEWVE